MLINITRGILGEEVVRIIDRAPHSVRLRTGISLLASQ
jgi:hypothetical protein